MRVQAASLAFAMLVCSATGSSGSELEPSAKPAEIRSLGYDDREASYFDLASIIRVGEVVKVTVILIKRPEESAGDGVHRADVFYEVECTGGRGTITGANQFDADGKLVGQPRFATKWHPIANGSMPYFLREKVCSEDLGVGSRLVADVHEDARLTFTYLSPKMAKPAQIRRVHRDAVSATYLDAATLERKGDVTRVKVISVYNSPRDGTAISEITEDFDCVGNRSNFVAAVEYDAMGEILKEGVYTSEEWSDLVPNSIGDEFRKAVCTPAAVLMAPVVKDYRADAAEGFGRKR